MPLIHNLTSKLKNLPRLPGVYFFKDKAGKVIYIGKAKNLRSRVRQYFQGNDERPQIPYLLKEITDFDVTIVHNELESLYLENSLIKQYLPKYNIDLRDDKNYAFIKIDYSTQIPQLIMARKIEEDGLGKLNSTHYSLHTTHSVFFGPYSSAHKIKNTLRFIRKIFPYCAASKISTRPCFYFHLHRCPGVCIGKISLAEYNKQLQKIAWFLAGNTAKVKAELKKEMLAASKAKKFESAARLRDQLNSLTLLEEKQIAILTKKVGWDVISLFLMNDLACINLFKIRAGKLLDKENFIYEYNPDLQIKYGSEIIQVFLEKYYSETNSAPQTIFLQSKIEDEDIVKKLILERFGKKVSIKTPERGKAKQLVTLGKTNAEEYLKNHISSKADSIDKIQTALSKLKEILNLPQIPKRIECYDISNLQGTNPVGSMVVFVDGMPAKSEYRKFKIQSKTTPDDFAMMKEMLNRRFAHLGSAPIHRLLEKPTNGHATKTNKPSWPLPDLIVIDGGKGQLNAALAALRISNYSNYLISKKSPNSKVQIPIIGLAKRIEEIFLPHQKNPIILGHDNPALQLLQRLRDEAHRFGITFHRSLRSKQAVKSALDDISGVGPKTKKLLKAKFGTVAEIKKAPLGDLEELVGNKLAKEIKESL